ncbi:MAG: hypothetical protein LBQ73_07125 [Tannerellaceae bacterium]|jgi:hypothetical protein|nr:hypothetical protein [Tannerellaceae bacterium]
MKTRDLKIGDFVRFTRKEWVREELIGVVLNRHKEFVDIVDPNPDLYISATDRQGYIYSFELDSDNIVNLKVI